jgi:hypothetical protein
VHLEKELHKQRRELAAERARNTQARAHVEWLEALIAVSSALRQSGAMAGPGDDSADGGGGEPGADGEWEAGVDAAVARLAATMQARPAAGPGAAAAAPSARLASSAEGWGAGSEGRQKFERGQTSSEAAGRDSVMLSGDAAGGPSSGGATQQAACPRSAGLMAACPSETSSGSLPSSWNGPGQSDSRMSEGALQAAEAELPPAEATAVGEAPPAGAVGTTTSAFIRR